MIFKQYICLKDQLNDCLVNDAIKYLRECSNGGTKNGITYTHHHYVNK